MTPFQTLLQEQQKDRARPPPTTTTVSMHRYLSKEEEGTHKSALSPQAHHINNNQILHHLSSSSSSSSSTLEESEYHALSSPTVIDTPLPFQFSSSTTSPTMTPDERYPSNETTNIHLHPYSNNNIESTATSNHNHNHNNSPNNNNSNNNSNNNNNTYYPNNNNHNYLNNINNNNSNNNSIINSNSNNKTETRSFMNLANDLDRSPRIAPPPIRTKWSDDLKKRDYPLTFSSTQSLSSKSDKPSPSTPRSLLPLLPPLDSGPLPSTSLHPPHRSYFAGPFDSPSKASFHRHHILPTSTYFSESPMEYRSTPPLVTPPLAPPQQQPPQPQPYHQYQHYNHLHEHPYLEEHDMEHCSEQDDVREREYGEDDEDEDDDDKELELRRQQHCLTQQQQQQQQLHQQQQLRYPTPSEQVLHHGEEEEVEDEEEDARSKQAKKKRPNRAHHSQSSVSSVVSDLALGVPTSVRQDIKGPLSKATPAPSSSHLVSTKAKSGPTSIQATLENVLDQIEDDNQGHDGSGVHSQAGRGLRFYSQRVCDRVQAKGATTYNELVHELSGGQPGEFVEDAVGQEPSGQENIRRRVYDALNVLEALDIISMDKKEIQWIGVENSRVLNETTKKVGASHGNHRRELDEESEEPEDDDMDIEQLQREVDALKLRNELERAQLQDQVSRHVQLNNLVARNKLREAKEQERHERRKQRKLKREEERARGNADVNNDECNPDHMEPTTEEKKKKSERRHRSPRHRENESGEQGEDDEEDMEEGEGETKEERRARKQARRERREKRAQRREQRDSGIMLTEEEKIQMPFVVVRIPRYGHQSSDSEANISVVRRSREPRSKKSGKTKRQEDTTTVEIQIPHQEELCIISDTEILGDLGLGTVSLNDLKTMLPKDLLGNARYVTNPGNVTVHGGFERVVCSH